MALSYAQLEGIWIQGGGNPGLAPLMAAIALAESGGNPGSVNPNDNGGRQSSFGLWQISTGTHTPPAPNWSDPVENATLAVQKYRSQGLGAWGTYTSGAYQKYFEGSVAPQQYAAPTGTTGAASPTSGGSSPPSGIGAFLQGVWAGITGGSGAAPVWVGGLATAFDPIIEFFDSLNKVFSSLLWIVNPIHWLRIIAGVFGFFFLVAGIVVFAGAV